MKKKVQVTIEYCNVFYIEKLLQHVKGVLRMLNYIVVEQGNEADYKIGVFVIEDKVDKPLQVIYTFDKGEDKERTLKYLVDKNKFKKNT